MEHTRWIHSTTPQWRWPMVSYGSINTPFEKFILYHKLFWVCSSIYKYPLLTILKILCEQYYEIGLGNTSSDPKLVVVYGSWLSVFHMLGYSLSSSLYWSSISNHTTFCFGFRGKYIRVSDWFITKATSEGSSR